MDENAPFFPPKTPKDRKKAGVPRIIPPLVWLTAIFLVGLVLGNLLWFAAADMFALERTSLEVEFTVSPSDSLTDIADNLAAQGLIARPGLFRLYARLTGAAAQISPGTYTLNARWDYSALLTALRG